MTQGYRCWAEIDRSALRHNAQVVRERIGSAEILAVVKANAYGHGMVGVAETLAEQAQLFGVANLEEAITLRQSLPHPIVILGPTLPQERSVIVEGGFIPTVSTFQEALQFEQASAEAMVPINFKIDTGMGRMGIPEMDAIAVFKKVAALPRIHIHSVSTHLPVSNEDADYTRDELQRFGGIMKRLRTEVPGDYKAHVLQSAGLLAFAQELHEIVRAGMILYGI